MKIIFDALKNNSNIEKHGISLDEAENLEWDLLFFKEDIRKEYGELRLIGFAPIDSRVYCVVFTDRGRSRRIISLRKANKREVTFYATKI